MIWNIIAILVALELFEAYWQRSNTLLGSITKSFYYYNKSIFLLLFMHLGYVYTLYISMAYNLLNWPILIILFLKTMDIFMKINLMDRVFVKNDIDESLHTILAKETQLWYYMLGVMTYPYLLYRAFQ